jgi:methylated-DNA-[protein]-cysteine S-methyltransferase
MRAAHTVIESPLGDLTLVAHDGTLAAVYFEVHARRPDASILGARSGAGFEAATEQLGQYFAGARTAFELELAPRGDAFQQRVWSLLRRIPYGETRSYGQLARELGDLKLAREVGAANARNPLSIIVPCHRVVGADGKLVGYAGGLERKRFLLALEGAAAVEQMTLDGLS